MKKAGLTIFIALVVGVLSVNISYGWTVPYVPGLMDGGPPRKKIPFDNRPESEIAAMLLAETSMPINIWRVPVIVKVLRALKEKYPFLIKGDWKVNRKGFFVLYEKPVYGNIVEVLWDGTYRVMDPSSLCAICSDSEAKNTIKMVAKGKWEDLLTKTESR